MCECQCGQCASGPIIMCERTWNVRVLVWCASPSLVNVRVVRFVQHRNVRVLV